MEWQNIREDIKKIRKELTTSTCIIEIQELQEDIERLQARKAACAAILGMK